MKFQTHNKAATFSGLCNGCGTRHQPDKQRIARFSTYHIGRCYCCGSVTPVTEERDYGYPDYPKHLDYWNILCKRTNQHSTKGECDD